MKRFASCLLTAAAVACALLPAPASVAAGLSSSVSVETLSPNDTQFFSLGTLIEGDVALGIATPVAGLPFDFDTPDTQLATLFTSDVGPGDLSSLLLTFNDDSDADNNLGAPNGNNGDSLGSLFRLESFFTDEYSVAVTGFDDEFEGSGHGESGDYLLTLGTVDPTTLGGDFADTDGSNELMSGADVLGLADGESQIAVNSLVPGAPGDVDFYQIDLNAGDVFTAMTAPLRSLSDDFDSPDTLITFFDADGNILFDDDDAGGPESDLAAGQFFLGDPLGSALHFLAPETATYYFAVTGFPDEDAVGAHGEQGPYALLVSRVRVIPEPASCALLGVALWFAPRCRRRKA